MKREWRDWVLIGVVWLLLTAAGEILLWRVPIFPSEGSREAAISDEAFRLLVRLAVPVFTFVITMLVVSVARFRVRSAPTEDGPPLWGTRPIFVAWLAITGVLAGVLIVDPGIVGLVDIRGESTADLVVALQSSQWAWSVTYPDLGVTTGKELVLPVDRRVRFDVTSKDVLHSFWIPSFRVKVDAIPGYTTTIYTTPTRTGSSDTDPNLRIQCAELCGLGHSSMTLQVRVVSEPEFDAWIRSLSEEAQGGPPTCEPSGGELRVVAQGIAFDQGCLAAPADTPFTIAFDNRDEGVPHNVAIYTDEGAATSLFVGEIVTGSVKIDYEVPGIPAGDYFFRCDVHPTAMTGSFVVA
jgi:cytochrome c oxidase subunit 2